MVMILMLSTVYDGDDDDSCGNSNGDDIDAFDDGDDRW